MKGMVIKWNGWWGNYSHESQNYLSSLRAGITEWVHYTCVLIALSLLATTLHIFFFGFYFFLSSFDFGLFFILFFDFKTNNDFTLPPDMPYHTFTWCQCIQCIDGWLGRVRWCWWWWLTYTGSGGSHNQFIIGFLKHKNTKILPSIMCHAAWSDVIFGQTGSLKFGWILVRHVEFCKYQTGQSLFTFI